MKPLLRILATLILLFNGIGALYGGWNLMMHPDGSSLQMTLEYLQYSPFRNYLIPGIILFTANGLFSFIAIFLLLLRHRRYPWFILAQGALLTGWILIQILMVRMVVSLHYIMGSTGLILLLIGFLLLRLEKKRSLHPPL